MSLEVRICKRLPGFTLEADFDCGLETLALLGASGSGKSLTLSCIAGVARPDEGRIALDGRVMFDSAARIDLPPQRRRVGLLFQSYALFPTMTVERNILCGLRGMPGRAERRARASELVRALELEGLERRYPAQLSQGQRQRVALARLWASRPGALLLDEPFSALDETLKWQLEQELTDWLARMRVPALYVTHDMREVRRLCDRACVLDAGRAQPAQTPEALLARPGTVAAARLSGCENIASARLLPDGLLRVDEWGACLHLAEPPSRAPEGVGIRAARVRLGDGPNALPASVLRVVPNENGRVAVCALQATGARLRAALPADCPCAPGDRATLSLPPEALLPLYPAAEERATLKGGIPCRS